MSYIKGKSYEDYFGKEKSILLKKLRSDSMKKQILNGLKNTGKTHFKKGMSVSPETQFKKGAHNSPKTEFKKGQTPWNKGIHYTAISGEKNNNWNGGITKLYVKIRTCIEYRTWRTKIFTRDGFKCASCQQVGGKLQVHHIKPFSKIISENKIKTLQQALECKELWLFENAVTLCAECHKDTENYLNKHRGDR